MLYYRQMSRRYKKQKKPPRNYYLYVEQLIMSLQLQFEIILASDNLLWSIKIYFFLVTETAWMEFGNIRYKLERRSFNGHFC